RCTGASDMMSLLASAMRKSTPDAHPCQTPLVAPAHAAGHRSRGTRASRRISPGRRQSSFSVVVVIVGNKDGLRGAGIVPVAGVILRTCTAQSSAAGGWNDRLQGELFLWCRRDRGRRRARGCRLLPLCVLQKLVGGPGQRLDPVEAGSNDRHLGRRERGRLPQDRAQSPEVGAGLVADSEGGLIRS